MKAWIVKSKSNPNAAKGLVWADTQGKAKYKAIKSDSVFCNFAKYHLKYLDMLARRMPDFDNKDGAMELPIMSSFIFDYDDEGKKISNEK